MQSRRSEQNAHVPAGRAPKPEAQGLVHGPAAMGEKFLQRAAQPAKLVVMVVQALTGDRAERLDSCLHGPGVLSRRLLSRKQESTRVSRPDATGRAEPHQILVKRRKIVPEFPTGTAKRRREAAKWSQRRASWAKPTRCRSGKGRCASSA